ncbi:tannase/feruloyl esterase family alpha/beta hydrolase [Flammeovirga sp. SubArs3]|uniref:tannase/feruloyl esterase family alpha/beta hydrolase n=1 Tax=Flammeovirga sp. SubArs3 TaxID=2995316 RepID=UPI00248B43A3|nr:tannase/feruloyl esterase family alpha/beta hydrolase [Flammeovirga sp. SubArs3]
MNKRKMNLIKVIILAFSLSALVGFTYNTKYDKNKKGGNPDNIPEIADVNITSISKEEAMAPHYKVAGIIGENIKFELLLPEDWNGKFVFGGGAGFVGSVINLALSYNVLEKGYATVGTDTGHEGANPIDGRWAEGDMEAIVNFGHMAVHRTTVVSKAIIEAFYNNKIEYSYFVGCSRGGGQAMMEAQRYPDDFDGIVAGAPAYEWTSGLAMGMTHNVSKMFPDPNNLDEPLLSISDLKLVEDAYLEMCDELDGIKDGILNDPRACHFDIETLLCEGDNKEDCLSQEQIDALKAIYEGPQDKNGDIFYGFPFGGETHQDGWAKWITGGLNHVDDGSTFHQGIDNSSEEKFTIPPNYQYGFGTHIMKFFIYQDSAWTYTDYDYDTFRDDALLIGQTLNASSPDLSKFRANGGKLMMYSGWSDPAITSLGTIGYYEDVIDFDETAQEDVKLFMMPGVLHCAGGDGPWYVNWVDEIDNWVANEKDPEQITVYFIDEDMKLAGSRLLCPYPTAAEYDGVGDTRDVRSFNCGN